jgi:putative heme iron utilization protein
MRPGYDTSYGAGLWHNPDGNQMVTENLAFEARCLVRGAASATLATQAGAMQAGAMQAGEATQAGGQPFASQPFASLVTPAAAADGAPLLLLSSLSEHTRHLRAEPRCALLFTGTPDGPNPQTAPRVTLTGLAAEVPAAEVPALKARWLARHPYAAMYADFADFALWRMAVGGALLVGGFARAHRLKLAEWRPDPAAVAAIAAAAEDIIGHVNADHVDAVAAIAIGLLGGPPGEWRMVGVDVDGADLAAGDAVRRLAFAGPVAEPGQVRTELMRAAREGRSRRG